MRYLFEEDDIIPGRKICFNRVRDYKTKKLKPAPNTEHYTIIQWGFDHDIYEPMYGLISSDFFLWIPSYLPKKKFIDFLNGNLKISSSKLEDIKYVPVTPQ